MRIPLDRQSDTPLYQQIETFLRQGILSGSLAPDTRLPAVRELARDLGINRITVENAYAELEAAGLVSRRIGSGSYVLPPCPLPSISPNAAGVSWPLWQQNIQTQVDVSPTRLPPEMQYAARHPRWINFASGVSDPNLFPVDAVRKVMQAVIRRDGISAMEYGDPQGYAPLRSTIAYILASQGIQTHPDHVLITAGSQQGIGLVAQLLLQAGDVVIVERPTYSGALELFRSLGLKIVDITLDEHGMQVEYLERLLQQQHAKLIYTIPNFQNPTGACLSSQRRRQLIALADRYNVPILEDDFVGDLRYEGHSQPALKALDPGGRVIYVSTFSKMLMPGLRVGFLVAEGPVYDALAHRKRFSDLATSNLNQRVLEAYVTVGRYQAHLRRTCQVYHKRRDAMLKAVDHYLPQVRLHPPQGGMFLWLSLPHPWTGTKLLPLACEQGVSFAPGGVFFAESADGESFMRLNFAAFPPEEIEEGIKRLGKAMR